MDRKLLLESVLSSRLDKPDVEIEYFIEPDEHNLNHLSLTIKYVEYNQSMNDLTFRCFRGRTCSYLF
jgi:hypothetical protein